MHTLEDLLNIDTMPLWQWRSAIGDKPSEGKAHEDTLTHYEIIKELIRENARSMIGIISDEGRLELRVATHVPSAIDINLLTFPGEFEQAARKTVADHPMGPMVNIVTDIDAIAPASKDAAVLNMIAGDIATPGDHGNLGKILKLVSSYVKEDGHVVLVRPNATVGETSTYKCLTDPDDLRPGGNYEFMVKGLEHLPPMKSLYTPLSFLEPMLAEADLAVVHGLSRGIMDTLPDGSTGAERPAFLLNVCRKVSRARGPR